MATVRGVGLRSDTKVWINYLILILLISLSVTPLITGHPGVRLVYQYGVGPMGNRILIK
ncbi:putative membrane protein [Sphingobacterium sp. 2149]|nr:putative membrane protein [Sphingobacterium sp. 2149]